jgi:hypothetical protein
VDPFSQDATVFAYVGSTDRDMGPISGKHGQRLDHLIDLYRKFTRGREDERLTRSKVWIDPFQDPNGKEDDKKLFRKCMINPDVKKKTKAEEKKLVYSLKEIEDWCPKTCEALQPNIG